MDRWPHQIHGVQETLRAHVDGFPVVVLTSPTGGGKSLMMCDLIDDSLSKLQRSVLYTNRRMLMEQTVKVLHKHGIRHGVRAAGWESSRADTQIASLPTEHSRSMRRKITHLHDAQLVIVDEAHMQKGKMADAILTEHRQAGANIVLVTATPIDLGLVAGVEPKLVVAGTTSELRRC